MRDDDFERNIKAALDDIVDSAPKPPKWKWMTGGRARLTSYQASPWYRRGGAAFLGAAAVAVLVVGVAALVGSGISGDDQGDDQAIGSAQEDQSSDSHGNLALVGRWTLVSYEDESQEIAVEEGINTATMPWIEFYERTPEGLSDGQASTGTFDGNTGCNEINDGFAVGYEYSAGFLVLDEAIIEAVFCDPSIEDIVMAMLWGSHGIEVELGEDTMTWHGSNLNGQTYPLTFRRDGPPVEASASCSGTLFDLRYTEGPELTVDEFLATEEGRILDAFFDGGPGGPEGGLYLGADGFSVVSDSFVLSYKDGVLIGDFGVRDGEVAGWGSCNPGLAVDNMRATRFRVVGPIDPTKTVVPILVQGGACGEADGDHITTEVVDIKVHEQEDAVLITAWTREIAPPSADHDDTYTCAGIGIELEAFAVLKQPLGGRVVLDGGQVPPGAVEIAEPPPQETASCSTTAMEGVEFEDYAPSWEGLPDEVADTRNRLLNAAVACDFEQIAAIAQEGAAGDGSDSIFWGATTSLDELKQYDTINASLRSLVLALTTLPWQAIDAETHDAESEEIVPRTYYTWPPVTNEFEGGSGLADQWSADLLERVAAVNEQTIVELIVESGEVGAYWGFRVGINEDGSWLFALAGD